MASLENVYDEHFRKVVDELKSEEDYQVMSLAEKTFIKKVGGPSSRIHTVKTSPITSQRKKIVGKKDNSLNCSVNIHFLHKRMQGLDHFLQRRANMESKTPRNRSNVTASGAKPFYTSRDLAKLASPS